MVISIEIILTIVIWHWISDFIMQDENWAINKSKSFEHLLYHTITYSFLWVIPLMFIFPTQPYIIFTFVGITFVLHTLTDFLTSKWVSKKFERKEFGTSIPNRGAFSVIGFDQTLHYVQLFLTYLFLK